MSNEKKAGIANSLSIIASLLTILGFGGGTIIYNYYYNHSTPQKDSVIVIQSTSPSNPSTDQVNPGSTSDSKRQKCFQCNGLGYSLVSSKCTFCDGSGSLSILCKDCAGKGTIVCDRCQGSKGTECYACRGQGQYTCTCDINGQIYCPDCHGGNYEITSLVMRGGECPTCHNKKVLTCDKCGGTHVLKCPNCKGTGRSNCTGCNGLGYLSCSHCQETGKNQTVCSNCSGTGLLAIKESCSNCSGTGWK